MSLISWRFIIFLWNYIILADSEAQWQPVNYNWHPAGLTFSRNTPFPLLIASSSITPNINPILPQFITTNPGFNNPNQAQSAYPIPLPNQSINPVGSNDEPFLLGGVDVPIREAPYVAVLFSGKDIFELYPQSTATIISKTFLLTAAKFIIRHVITFAGVGNEILYKTKKYQVHYTIAHEEFHLTPFNSLINNIAIVKLLSPLDLVPGLVEPILLAPQNPVSGSTAYVYGWGWNLDIPSDTDQWRMTRHLKGQQTVIRQFDECEHLSYYIFLQPYENMCDVIQLKPETAYTYIGEDGSPVVVKHNNLPMLVALNSWGERPNSYQHVNVYTSINFHRDWIEKYLREEEF